MRTKKKFNSPPLGTTSKKTTSTIYMASTSLANTRLGKHDVFLSFRGADTRDNFVSHLHHELVDRNGIETYIDYRLRGGEEIEPALLEKIQESLISVVIFSKNYADSTFCLRELFKILECKNTLDRMIIPVFYQVDPTDVQEMRGSFADGLAKLQGECSEEEMKGWRHALKEIANLKGWDSNVIKPDTKLIEKIVEDVRKRLHEVPSYVSSSSVSERMVGIDSRVDKVISLLCIESPAVLKVGIWGMPGIGKTTIAEAVYARLSPLYEGRCFLRNVREESDKHGLLHVREQILQEVLGVKNLENLKNMTDDEIKRMLKRKKVLIVLDDVSSPQQLIETLGEDGLLGEGSRIIVTSRDKELLEKHCDKTKTYEVQELQFKEALQLFKFHAFKGNQCPEGFKKLSERAVNYTKRNPLALKVLGSNLYNKRIKEWENALANLNSTLDSEILKILMLSYDGLDWKQKRIFLDIACFFRRCNRYLVQQVLDSCGFNAESGIDRLIDMCLLNISEENEIWMHDLLLQLGQDIVHQENYDDPRKRSRLWILEDINDVLTHYQSAETVQAISLDLSKIEGHWLSGFRFLEGLPIEIRGRQSVKRYPISPTAFQGMCNLRLLEFFYPSLVTSYDQCNLHLPQGLTYLPNKLRVLRWDLYPLDSLPRISCPVNLVELRLRFSKNLKITGEFPPLVNLKFFEVTWAENLTTIDPVLSVAPNLEVVKLDSCKLIGSFMPPQLHGLSNLKVLRLINCSSLSKCPSIEYCTNLTTLDFKYCESLRILPSSIGSLSKLAVLDLTWCVSLESLPSSIVQLTSLERLFLFSCSKLPKLPDSIGSLVSLRKLCLSDSEIEIIPESIKQLPELTAITLFYCRSMKVLPELPPSLKLLIMTDCRSLESVSSIFTEGEKEYEAASENFHFFGCHNLGQNESFKIMADARLRIQRMATSQFRQKSVKLNESGKSIGARFCVPGTEIPEWFEYKNTKGSSLQIIRQPDWHCYNNSSCAEFLGFAFCAVVAFRDIPDFRCECDFVTEGGGKSALCFPYLTDDKTTGYEITDEDYEILWGSGSSHEHVFIWYDWNIKSNKFFNEASFSFKSSEYPRYGDETILKCGVHLLYAQDDDGEQPRPILIH